MTARIAALLIILVAASPIATFAQSPGTPPASAEPFAPSVSVGKTVWVTTAEGAAVRGEVASISSTTLDLSTKIGAQHFAASDVLRIQKKDSNKNGFWIGAGVGVIGAGFGVLAASAISGEAPSGDTAGQIVGFVAFGAALWGGIGALVDNAISGRQTLYLRPAGGSAGVVNITPLVSVAGRKRIGLGGSISWE